MWSTAWFDLCRCSWLMFWHNANNNSYKSTHSPFEWMELVRCQKRMGQLSNRCIFRSCDQTKAIKRIKIEFAAEYKSDAFLHDAWCQTMKSLMLWYNNTLIAVTAIECCVELAKRHNKICINASAAAAAAESLYWSSMIWWPNASNWIKATTTVVMSLQ